MSLPPVSAETLGHLSDEAEVAPQGSGGKRGRRGKQDSIVGKSPMQIALGRLRRDKVAVVCFVVVTLFVLIAILAVPLMSLFGVSDETVRPIGLVDPLNGGIPLIGPPNHGFTMDHPFGIAPNKATDNLAYWLKGAQTSMLIATSATIIASLVGVVLGLIAGFAGGTIDRIISFVTDFFLTVPFLLAALSMAPIISERFSDQDNYATIQRGSLIVILALFGWMSIARLIRGEVLSLREREFIMAARVLGMPTRRVLIRELLPNLVAPIVVSVSLMLPAFVAAEAGLAYLGIGVTDGKSWGQIINDGTRYFEKYPLYLYEPLLGIVLLVISLNLLGDAIRDALDPKTRR
jgi:peptide/nickel transport system permease protein